MPMDFEEGNFEELPKMEPTDEENIDHEARQEARRGKYFSKKLKLFRKGLRKFQKYSEFLKKISG